MHAISREILEKYQTRLRRRQKTEFIEWLVPKLEANGYSVKLETKQGLIHNRNIVIGDVTTAKVVFGAHYDTQAVIPIPIVMTPKNLPVYIVMQLPILIMFIAAMILAELGLLLVTGNILAATLGALFVVYLLTGLLISGVPNRHTANDNTSGVITLIESMLSMPRELRDKAAFVLFDNEEYGLVGSRYFLAQHKNAMNNKQLVNFDCVSDGDNIHIHFSKRAKKDKALVDAVERSFVPANGKGVVIERGFFLYTSDQMGFPKNVAVCALKPSKWIGPYLDRIHTNRDVIFDERNITLLRDGVVAYVGAI